jgi:hypothetical protein
MSENKYLRSPIPGISCGDEVTDADLDVHLRAFIEQYVQKDIRGRWIEFLIDRRDQWDRRNRSRAQAKLLEKTNSMMNSFSPTDPSASRVDLAHLPTGWLANNFGDRRGVLFCPYWTPAFATASEAVQFFYWDDSSALLSFTPGEDALYFCHGGEIFGLGKE